MAPVTKELDKVSTLIERYFRYNILDFDTNNLLSYLGKKSFFYMYFRPRFGLLTRNPNWSFQKFSARFVKSIEIPVCDALIQKSHCL